MSDTPSVLTVIPAKARSRRLPGKNMALLAGRPLVVHAVEQALASGVCGEICVATDDPGTAEVATGAGAQVPFLREGDCDDRTSVGEATCRFIRRYMARAGRAFDLVCLLLVTSPLRAASDIRGCYDRLLSEPSLDAVMSFVKAEKHPCWAWQMDDQQHAKPLFPDDCDLGRDQLPVPYYIDGSIYWARVPFFLSVNGNQYRGRVGGYPVPADRAVDVDTPLDLKWCQLLLAELSETEGV